MEMRKKEINSDLHAVSKEEPLGMQEELSGEELKEQEYKDQEPVSEEEEEEESEEFTEIYVWGNDYYGQLGVGSDKCIHRVPKICSFNIIISQVSCGEDHTAFISQPGGHVYSMGSNSEGKLGIGDSSMKSSNVPCLVEDLTKIEKVVCGTSHTLALSKNGQVFAWGQRIYGALGLGEDIQEGQYLPTLVEMLTGERIFDIAAGSRHSLFTGEKGVYSCGDGKSGQLGIGYVVDNETSLQKAPVRIQSLASTHITQVACGKFHSFFITDQQEVYGCGGNSFGQLGIGSKKNQYTPVQIPELSNVKSISSWHFSGAVTNDNQLYIWGMGIFGEFLKPRLFDPSELLPSKGIQSGSSITDIRIGGSFGTLLDSSGRTLVWGANTNGEMGLGDSKARQKPVYLEILEDKQVTFVGVGSSFAFALGPRLKIGVHTYQTFETEQITNTIIEEQEEGSSQQEDEEDKHKEIEDVKVYIEDEEQSFEGTLQESIFNNQQQMEINELEQSGSKTRVKEQESVKKRASSEKKFKKSVHFSTLNQQNSSATLQRNDESQNQEVIKNLRNTIQDLIYENDKLSNQVKDLKQLSETKRMPSSLKKSKKSQKVQLDNALNQLASQEREISDLQYRLRDKDQVILSQGKQIDKLKSENAQLQNCMEELRILKVEREEMKKWEGIMKKQIVELESQSKIREDYDTLKQDIDRLRKEHDQTQREKQDLLYKMARMQKEQTLRSISNSNYTPCDVERKENLQQNQQRRLYQRPVESEQKQGTYKTADFESERYTDQKQLNSSESQKSQLSNTISIQSFRKDSTPCIKGQQQHSQLNPVIPEFTTSKFGSTTPAAGGNQTFDYDENLVVNISSHKDVSYLAEKSPSHQENERNIDRESRDRKGILADKDVNKLTHFQSISNSYQKQELQPRVHFNHTIQYEDEKRVERLKEYESKYGMNKGLNFYHPQKDSKRMSTIPQNSSKKLENPPSALYDRRASANVYHNSSQQKSDFGGISVKYEPIKNYNMDWRRPSTQLDYDRGFSKSKLGFDSGKWNPNIVSTIKDNSEYEPISRYSKKPIVQNRVGTIQTELNPQTAEYESVHRYSSPFGVSAHQYYDYTSAAGGKRFASNERPQISRVGTIAAELEREEEIRRRVESRMQKDNYEYQSANRYRERDFGPRQGMIL